jgi:hypothetical protein
MFKLAISSVIFTRIRNNSYRYMLSRYGCTWLENFTTFINDYSRYMDIYLLHNKNETLDAFKAFKAEVENRCGK